MFKFLKSLVNKEVPEKKTILSPESEYRLLEIEKKIAQFDKEIGQLFDAGQKYNEVTETIHKDLDNLYLNMNKVFQEIVNPAGNEATNKMFSSGFKGFKKPD